ncbi:uncharacterized protein K452DRAFT_96604 [Aplosporella prunicola CBS 121167]|uniref:Uncharacterized protein n=1 Tax=Aplosporella prunicola CBS 121167 TaxID=1176127 RepID=A0A6A6B148_9PEZI|nr:uncharacterized protein K452DRAFT_96604 [Aplosporella prunicola CBS 121167]KAF2137889.1 hypothetical protein K452DRAFT_96604 [Aplosporella prunicola CBS 121167]
MKACLKNKNPHPQPHLKHIIALAISLYGDAHTISVQPLLRRTRHCLVGHVQPNGTVIERPRMVYAAFKTVNNPTNPTGTKIALDGRGCPVTALFTYVMDAQITNTVFTVDKVMCNDKLPTSTRPSASSALISLMNAFRLGPFTTRPKSFVRTWPEVYH